MTNKEASEELKEEFEIFKNCINKADWENPDEELKKIIEANTMAIEVLGQMPCEDCISREAVLDTEYQFKEINGIEYVMLSEVQMKIRKMPSVTPKYTDEEIDKAQAIEQAYIDKMVELAVEELKTPKAKWIPVSERLPEELICDDGYVEPSDYVLVWGNYGNYGVSRYWGNRRTKSESPNTYKDWMDLDWVVQKPIAWMPLPEAYKESEVQE